MSTQEEVVADSRYTAAEKFPAHLGSDPSEEALKALFSNFGKVWLSQITNNSGNIVKFYNPYDEKRGEIAPGATESILSKGYLPLWGYHKRYEITYRNKALNDWTTMFIKDLEHYLLSFEQTLADELHAVNPPPDATVSFLNLIINKSGYEIYDALYGRLNSRIAFHSK